MNRIIKSLKLKPGDRIVVPKSGLRWVMHHAIYLGQNHQGVDLIVENKLGHGVRLITADLFFRDVIEITKIEKFSGSDYQRRMAVQEALRNLGKRYDLINYNCEHFANEVQSKKITSQQVTDGIGLALLAVIIGAAIR